MDNVENLSRAESSAIFLLAARAFSASISNARFLSSEICLRDSPSEIKPLAASCSSSDCFCLASSTSSLLADLISSKICLLTAILDATVVFSFLATVSKSLIASARVICPSSTRCFVTSKIVFDA